jgi:hypothetical protein
VNSLLGRYFAAVIGFGFVAVWISVGITAAVLCLFGSAGVLPRISRHERVRGHAASMRAIRYNARVGDFVAADDRAHYLLVQPTGRPTRSDETGLRGRGIGLPERGLHQRARHLDAARRCERDAGDQAGGVRRCTTADLPAAGRRGSLDHHGLAPMSLSSEHTAPRCRSSDRRQYERL